LNQQDTKRSIWHAVARLGRVLWRRMAWVIRRFIAHDCLTIAGSLTFTAMLALVPLMTIVYLGLAFLPEFGVLAEQVERFVFQNFVPSSSAAVQNKLNEFAGRAGDLTTLGLIGLTITALGLVLSIECHFNALWHVGMPPLSLRRLVSLVGLLTVGPSLVLAALWISTYVLSLPLLATLDVIGVAPMLLSELPLLCLFLVFSILFKVVPNALVVTKHALLGGFLSATVFKVAFEVFAWFSGYLVYDAIYGVLAALPIFLLWLYVVWVIVLMGALFVCSFGAADLDQN
jgi:membrane protein